MGRARQRKQELPREERRRPPLEAATKVTELEKAAIMTVFNARAQAEMLAQRVTAEILQARRLPMDTHIEPMDLQNGLVIFRSPSGLILPGTPPPEQLVDGAKIIPLPEKKEESDGGSKE